MKVIFSTHVTVIDIKKMLIIKFIQAGSDEII